MKHLFFISKKLALVPSYKEIKILDDTTIERKFSNLKDNRECFVSFFSPLLWCVADNDKIIIKFRILQIFKKWNLIKIEKIEENEVENKNTIKLNH
jgi:hypothetical protein